MYSSNQFALEPSSYDASIMYDIVYNLSMDYASSVKNRFGNQVSGVVYLTVNGRSVMLNLDTLPKGSSQERPSLLQDKADQQTISLIIPGVPELKKTQESLGGAIDHITSDNAAFSYANRKFEMDFNGKDSRRSNGSLGNFIIFFKKICQDPDVRPTTRTNYMYTYDKMLEFASLADFSDVTLDFLKKFEHWLSEHYGCNENTIAKHVKVLRKAVNQAIRLGYMDIRNNPFFEYCVRLKKTEKEVLSLNDLALIDSYFHNRFDLMSENDREILGAFLFSCYTGLRFSDLRSVTRKHIVKRRTKHWLEMATQKTGKVVKIPLDEIFGGRTMEILKRFNRKTGRLFMISSNAVCNRRIKVILKQVHKRIKYKHISFHTARRTMATLLLALQVPITTVQTLLGHSSIKTTEVYAKVKEQTVYNDIKRCKTKSMTALYERTFTRMRRRMSTVNYR